MAFMREHPMLVAISVIGAIAGIPPPAREQLRLGASTWLHMAEAYLVTGPPAGATGGQTSADADDRTISVPHVARTHAIDTYDVQHFGSLTPTPCSARFCVDQWSPNEVLIAVAMFLIVPTMCVVVTLCFAVWLVYTQPPQQARMAWYCLSAALQQYESSPAQVRATLVARSGMPPDQAAHFFQQLRKLLAAVAARGTG